MADSVSESELQDRFTKLQEKALKMGLTGKELDQLPSLQLFNTYSREQKWEIFRSVMEALLVLCVIPLVILIVWFLNWPVSNFTLVNMWMNFYYADVDYETCVVGSTEFLQDMGRPPISCEICRNLKEVPRVKAISNAEFEAKYAYSSVPVLVENAMEGWTATNTFNFSFFKAIYSEDSPALMNAERNCQFFPYKTSFHSLGEVFNMSEDRANLTDGTEPWYIGWSNCDSSAANLLRQHYERPYFLPDNAESSRTDWIFMGSPGYGAHMHIDNVAKPSWQAQVTGTKMWTLEPPPECYFQCVKQLKVVVNPGDVIVVDTNNWYHSTLILGKEMSITIGSEYD